MHDRVMSSPWAVQVELTEGCNLACPFCGLNGARGTKSSTYYQEDPKTYGPFKFMSLETASLLSDQCAEFTPNRRYEFAMHGEPTLNKNYIQILKMFRDKMPKAQIQLTTNGATLRNGKMVDTLTQLFHVGINFVILDTYEAGGRDDLRKQAFALPNDICVIDYCAEGVVSKSPWHNYGNNIKRTVFLMDDIGLVNKAKKNRVIYNHAGNARSEDALTESLQKRCSLPFREVSICYDGGVNVCCQDFAHDLRLSNIHERHLKDIWFGPEFEAVRSLLFSKQRLFSPCSRCNYSGGSRTGLLPEHAPPSENQKELIKALIECNPHKLNKMSKEVFF